LSRPEQDFRPYALFLYAPGTPKAAFRLLNILEIRLFGGIFRLLLCS